MSDPIRRCASTGPTRGRDDASAQLKNYAIAAGAVATAVGGVTGASNAAIVTSSGSGPVWAGSVNAAGTQSNSAWGDAFLNNKFWAVVIQAGSTATGARYMAFNNFVGRVHVGRLSTGAVIGANESTLFDLPQGFVKVQSNGSNAGWNAQPQTNMTSWSFGTSNAVRGFLAFRLGSTGQFNYGYFDLEFTRSSQAPGSTFAMTVHGWAYESTANQSITISGAAAVTGGAGLAALALGAAGVRGRRRKPA
jgi:hypothetical protein